MAGPTRRSRRSIRVVTALLVLSLGVLSPIATPPANAVTSNTYDFGFYGCRWLLVTTQGDYGGWAEVRTQDQNNGCRYLDANIRYTNSYQAAPRTVYLRDCAIKIATSVTCHVSGSTGSPTYVTLHTGSGRAQDTETAHWQSSGWR